MQKTNHQLPATPKAVPHTWGHLPLWARTVSPEPWLEYTGLGAQQQWG